MNDYTARFYFFKPLLIAISLIFPSGCATYKVSTINVERQLCKSTDTLSHPTSRLYRIIPRHRCQIRWYDIGHWLTWMIFGNDDDGIFGESQKARYQPCKKNNLNKCLSWWIRNPLHNFTFYTIGSAHRKNSEFTFLNLNKSQPSFFKYSSKAKHTFGSKDSSLFVALHGGKPYISVRLNYPWKRRTQFYIGWRERGNFGIKLQPMAKTPEE